jgi:pre-mRNA-splicing factor ATP-dependent RNA helicase DHX16
MQPPGDILVFLTGQEEIEEMEEILKQRTRWARGMMQAMHVTWLWCSL